MEVTILTPAIRKLCLRTGKHSHPSLEYLKATLFLVYAKQINKKGDLYVVVTAYNTDPQGSLPPSWGSVYFHPLFIRTQTCTSVSIGLEIHVISPFITHNAHPCPCIVKTLLYIKKNVPYFHASPQFNLKIPGIIFFFFYLYHVLHCMY